MINDIYSMMQYCRTLHKKNKILIQHRLETAKENEYSKNLDLQKEPGIREKQFEASRILP
jgi:hypothetical protein